MGCDHYRQKLPCCEGLDVAAMHTDADDDGQGLIVYLKYATPSVPAAAAVMSQGDLVIVSGPNGGTMIRIETFSPDHVVAVQADFQRCAHDDVAPDKHTAPMTSVSQIRLIHHCRKEIAQVGRYYNRNPGVEIHAEGRSEYLASQSSSL
eukprot:6175251-Pleurochrysis_carterae.AAC.1